MTKWKLHHWLFAAVGGGASAFLIFAGVNADRLARIGAGYKAKIACSEIFLAGRDAETVLNGEFGGIDPMMEQISVRVDEKKREVSAAGPLGLGRARAVYRDGYGCTLANAGRVRALAAAEPGVAADAWETAPAVPGKAFAHIDYTALDRALTDAFNGNEASHRAVVVAVDGKLVDERYTEGFSKDTPLLSWSMAKSITATLVGAARQRGLLEMDVPAPAPEWRGDAARAVITWNDLLQMQSGLAFEENYGKTRSDVNRMLFEMADTGALAAEQPLAHPPGDRWAYSSGTSNLISKLLRGVLTEAGVDYHSFGREAVFEPIGATSVVAELDATGNIIGSSFVYATARDWARLGQLYLQDGVWGGVRVLPEGWADYVAEPAAASDGQYGAHFWLNRDGADGRERFLPGLPEDVYFMSGHEGQYVFIIPSKRMVIVRTGMTRGRNPFEATAPLIKELYDAVGEPSAGAAP